MAEVVEQKACTKCGAVKPLADFYFDNIKRDGRGSRCVECVRAAVGNWNRTDEGIRRKREFGRKYCRRPEVKVRARENWLRNRYGLTPNSYDAMLIAQSGRCAICSECFTNTKREPHVDHDHSSGRVRGLLCFLCNTLLGNARDSKAVLLAACDYLE